MITEPKKLYRSRTNKIIAGVCGGLGDYFEIDPVLFRLAFVVLGLMNGVGILAYIIFILVIPKEPLSDELFHVERARDEELRRKAKEGGEHLKAEAREFAEKMREGHLRSSKDRKMLLGIILIVIGILGWAHAFLVVPWPRWNVVWPLVLVLLGFFMILRKRE